MTNDAFELLAGLVLNEDGATWGELAQPWQAQDARAIIRAEPRRHLLVRPRGASKTSDVAGIALSLLLSEAPAESRSYCYAVDRDQARNLLDALRGFVTRSPELGELVKISANEVTVQRSGASLTVEASDGVSAWNKIPWLVMIDELASWPATDNHRTLWNAIVSALPKRRDSRLVVMSMAGSPLHFAHRLYKQAQADPGWRMSHVPGPCPWWTPEDVEQVRRDLMIVTEGEFRRVILCEWVEIHEEVLAREEDVLACARDTTTLEPVEGTDYLAALDIGIRRDYTALAVGHVEPGDTGRRVVVDYTRHWRPSRLSRVNVHKDVEPVVLQVCRRYSAPLLFDRSQADDLVQRLSEQRVTSEEFVFSTSGAARLAKSLATALRDRRISIPDDEELIAELQTARLVESSPGVVKMVNPPGTHDDLAVVTGMLTATLLARPFNMTGYFGGSAMAKADVLSDLNRQLVGSANPWRATSPWATSLRPWSS